MVKKYFLLFFLISCSKQEQTIPYPQTESQVLNEFVRSAPLQYINLDEIPIINIRLTSDDVIYESGGVDNEEILGRLGPTIIEKDRLYAFERAERRIIQMNLDGEVEKTVVRNGRGPGEVLTVLSMDKSDSLIFTSDAANARINMYDLEFNYIKSIDIPRAMNIAVNNTYIGHRKLTDIGIPIAGLITITKFDSPKDSVAKVMPKIIPDGFQPLVFNATNFDLNNQDKLAASYTYLPWMFIFDSTFSLERTLIFESADYVNRKLLPLKIQSESTSNSSAIGYDGVISNFKYSYVGDLYIKDPLGIIHLKRKPDRSYEAVMIYKIEYPESQERFLYSNFEIFEDGTLMGAGWYHWFQVNLNEYH